MCRFRSIAAASILILSGAAARETSPGALVRHTTDGREKQRPAWSPAGRTLAFARHEDGGTHIWQYLLDTSANDPPRRLTHRTAPEHSAVFSPDGKSLLLVAITQSGTQGNLDIATLRQDGSGLELVARDTNGLSHQDWPAWSPDGKRFAFSSTHEGNQEIYTAAADGTDVVRVTQAPGLDAHPCWSPDGEWIAFATDRWGGLEIAKARSDGAGLVRLTKSSGLDDYPAWSPDGSRIAFVTNRDGQLEIYVMSAGGDHPVNVSRHPLRDTYPTWTPDGRGVTFVSNREGGCDIYTQAIGP
jgi:TolB protein